MQHYIEAEIVQHVPLDYQYPEKQAITLFARDVFAAGNENAEIMIFFNGGPGFSCIRDWRNTAWIIEALKTHRIILLDQRGTGRSQTIDLATIKAYSSPEILSDYLTHFRADNIVRDAEFLRENVLKRTKITILGQSFGGFVVLSYLSMAPQSLNSAFITAGIAPLACTSAQEIYHALIENICLRNEEFYQRFPNDKKKAQAIIANLQQKPMAVGGEVLTVERFLDLGWYFGQENGFDTVHHLLDEAFCDENMALLSWRFAKNVLQATSFWEMNPLYSILHEACYCNGYGSHWAADQVKQEIKAFSSEEIPPYFSGETVRQKMFKDYVGLQNFSAAADILANKTNWPMLYDIESLKNNTVPLSVLLMTDDFYVNYEFKQYCSVKLKLVNSIILKQFLDQAKKEF